MFDIFRYFYLFYSKMKIIRIFKDMQLHRLLLDLSLLSAKISLAMIIATFRMIVPCSMKRLLGETVLVSSFCFSSNWPECCNDFKIYVCVCPIKNILLKSKLDHWSRPWNWPRISHPAVLDGLYNCLLGQ